jgi:hypothetical protein
VRGRGNEAAGVGGVGDRGEDLDGDVGGGDCVEVALTGLIMVRDTIDCEGVVLAVSATAWRRFTASLKCGDK